MIELKNIKFSYPNSDFHLSINNLSIDAGQKTAVIGPSGFGKTTMLNLIAGILLPESGSVIIKEKEINNLQDAERRNFRIKEIGFVFQDFKLL